MMPAPTVSATARPGQLHLRTVIAKESRTVESVWRPQLGLALDRARFLAGWSLKELAAALDRDDAQVSRWVRGMERIQLEAVFKVPLLRRAFVVALAEIAGEGVEVRTEIDVRITVEKAPVSS
jgi:hypothetical protein